MFILEGFKMEIEDICETLVLQLQMYILLLNMSLNNPVTIFLSESNEAQKPMSFEMFLLGW